MENKTFEIKTEVGVHEFHTVRAPSADDALEFIRRGRYGNRCEYLEGYDEWIDETRQVIEIEEVDEEE